MNKRALMATMLCAALSVSLSSCSDDDDNPGGVSKKDYPTVYNVLSGKVLRSITTETREAHLYYNDRGQLIKMEDYGDIWTTSYGEKSINFSCDDGDAMIAYLNDNWFAKTIKYKYPSEAKDYGFAYDELGQMTKFYNVDIEWFDGDIISSSNSTHSVNVFYTSLENKGLMLLDNMFEIDLDDMELLWYAGILGVHTKHLPSSYVWEGSGNSTTDFQWTLDEDGYPIKLVSSSLYGNASEPDVTTYTFTWE